MGVIKDVFKGFPVYLHVLAFLGLFIGSLVGGSSPNIHSLWGAILLGVGFSIFVYLIPAVLILPDLIDMGVKFIYRKISPEHPIDETGFIDVELNSKGRVICPECDFNLAHDGRLKYCRCGAKLRVKQKHNQALKRTP